MKFSNKLIKAQIRYFKEIGLYSAALRSYNNCFFNKKSDEKHLISSLYRNCPLFFSLYLFSNCNDYFEEKINAERDVSNSFSGKYILSIYSDIFINGFENFLKTEKCYDTFFRNVDKNYIRHVAIKFVESDDKHKLVYSNLSPYGFIMRAFHWCDTPQGQTYWSDINTKWENECIIIANEIK